MAEYGVIGGTDTFIGREIASVLTARGCDVATFPGVYTSAGAAEEYIATTFRRERPRRLFVATGPSGGILENERYPVVLMAGSLRALAAIFDQAFRWYVEKVLYLASSCVYPFDCPQPMSVDSILSGPLEPRSQYYAIAKIAGIKLCEAYAREYKLPWTSAIVADCFGPGDDFSGEGSHVIAGLIHRMHNARRSMDETFSVWGSGKPKRDPLFIEDAAEGCIFAMDRYCGVEPINVGSGGEVSIADIAALVRDTVGYDGEIVFDTTMPDGAPRKFLDTAPLAALGWKATANLRDAIAVTYRWFLDHEFGGIM